MDRRSGVSVDSRDTVCGRNKSDYQISLWLLSPYWCLGGGEPTGDGYTPVTMTSIASVHPGRGILLCCSFLPLFPCKSFFSIFWEFFLIRCEVLGQGCLCVQIVKPFEANL